MGSITETVNMWAIHTQRSTSVSKIFSVANCFVDDGRFYLFLFGFFFWLFGLVLLLLQNGLI